jgi:hypothetical protein
MAIQSNKEGLITPVGGRTTTGRDYLRVPALGTLTMFYINITGGTASVDIEVSEDGTDFFAVRTGITSKTTHRVSWPCSIIAINVTSISGATVTVSYRQIIYDAPPDTIIESLEAGDVRARRITIEGDVSLIGTDGTPTRFYGPAQPGTTNGTLYTVPANKIAVIKTIHATNVTATAATVTMSIGGSTDAAMWVKGLSVPANDAYDWIGEELVLAAGETIQGLQGTTAAITVTLSGNLRDA